MSQEPGTHAPAPVRAGVWDFAARTFRIFLSIVILLFLAGLHFSVGLYLVLVLALSTLCAVGILQRIGWAWRGSLEYGFWRNPLRAEYRPQLWQFVNRILLYLFVAGSLLMVVSRFQVDYIEFLAAIILFALVPAFVLGVLEFLPRKRVYKSFNLLCAVCWIFLGLQMFRLLVWPHYTDKVVLETPFRGEWLVLQGGRSALVNHHYLLTSQRHALDVVRLNQGKTSAGDPSKLESYASFGQSLYAPSAGKVVRVRNDRPDQEIGTADSDVLVGNHVVLELPTGDRFVLLAHLMHKSIMVTVGENVQAGHLLGKCGNSGNTSEPHLHFQVQNLPDWDAPELQTFPIQFENITHVRWGKSRPSQFGELTRNDRMIVADGE